MINLAGNADCDRHIRAELTRCGIEVVEGERTTGEVPYSLAGKLGAFTFRRAWYYWIVAGPMPLDVARRLYAHPVGKTDIRVAGHCGCPPPEEPWVTWRDDEGNELVPESQREECEAMAERLPSIRPFMERQRFVPDPTAGRGFVESYHVDSELGLYLLAESIRALQSPPAPPVATSGVSLIATERARQVSVEGWTPEHDDEHDGSELLDAASCYLADPDSFERYNVPHDWPWDDAAWKPTPNDRVRELVKAGALIAAEIDRLLRARGESVEVAPPVAGEGRAIPGNGDAASHAWLSLRELVDYLNARSGDDVIRVVRQIQAAAERWRCNALEVAGVPRDEWGEWAEKDAAAAFATKYVPGYPVGGEVPMSPAPALDEALAPSEIELVRARREAATECRHCWHSASDAAADNHAATCCQCKAHSTPTRRE